MCGIIGGWWLNKPSNLDKKFSEGLNAIRHRGPNDSGFDSLPTTNGHLVFGHTRLSIIDLSSAGHQPFHSADGRYSLIFNGEIYNYKELRTELKTKGHEFKTQSDTEVLLAAWIQWRESSFTKFGLYNERQLWNQTSLLRLRR